VTRAFDRLAGNVAYFDCESCRRRPGFVFGKGKMGGSAANTFLLDRCFTIHLPSEFSQGRITVYVQRNGAPN
jgi:hypothetical protein